MKAIALLLSSLLAFPANSAVVFRAGAEKGGLERQKALCRAIENGAQGELCTERTIGLEELQESQARSRLIQKVSEAQKLAREPLSQQRVREWEKSVVRDQVTVGPGPEVQRSLVYQALLQLRLGNERQAATLVTRAVRMHPTREVESLSLWDESDHSGLERLKSWVLKSQLKPCHCEIKVSGDTPSAIWINGFEVTGSSLPLCEEMSYQLEAFYLNHWEKRTLRCQKPGLGEVFLGHGAHLRPGPPLRFYRRTEGQVVVVRGNESLVDSESAGLSVLQEPARFSALPSAPEPPLLGTSDSWLDDWKFWAVASLVVGGVAVAVQQGSGDTRQPLSGKVQ